MADVGRKAKINKEKYLRAVERKRTISDKVIAEYIGLNRSNVTRFRNNNPLIFAEAKEIILKFTSVVFDAKNISYDSFKEIPILLKYVDVMEGRTVSKSSIRERLRYMYNMCVHLNIHPENITLDNCTGLVLEGKKAYYADEKFIRGLAYLKLRKTVRSWFQLMHGISGEYLTSLGIGAEASKGSGSQSKERVLKEQRHKFDEVLKDTVYEIINNPRNKRLHKFKGMEKSIYLEMKGVTYFMYYTATRIGSDATIKQGALSIKMNNPKHTLTKDLWKINVIDKGKRGGIEWSKMLIDDGLIKLKEYISKRFKILFDELEIKVKTINKYLFPILANNYPMERKIMKLALEKVGVTTTIPNHIWRHTFAQDFLHASDWNYELCASIGGWKDTGTLKKHYGKMSEDAKERGLKSAMKIPVKDVTYKLMW
ncbi:hypothetical protein ES702_00692 [subsurface metagenome]